MGEHIQLQTAPLNQRLLAARQELTKLLDGLAYLEAETKKLSENWQGESFCQWEREMESCLEETGELAEKVKRLFSAVYQCGLSMVQLEQQMAQKAKGW